MRLAGVKELIGSDRFATPHATALAVAAYHVAHSTVIQQDPTHALRVPRANATGDKKAGFVPPSVHWLPDPTQL